MHRHPDQLRAWANINLSSLERNLAHIRHALPRHLRYLSVVKANAYGHGLEPVVTRLMRAQADAFAVANLDEAMRLRSVGTGWPVLVLSTLLPGEYADAIELGVRPLISSEAERAALDRLAAMRKLRLKVHLKIDTGMGRLGVWHREAADLIRACQHSGHLQLEGVCTHFACADSDAAFTRRQRQRFIAALRALDPALLRPEWIHADNSAGLESFPANGPFNAARIGLLQFGVSPSPSSGLLAGIQTSPVLSFHARVALCKRLPANSSVSYGRSYRLRRPATLAVLTAGYADGLPTALSNRGHVIIRGQCCPIVGRITMDQTMVDVSSLHEAPQPGEVATFIGGSAMVRISAESVAELAQSIPWEILCAISARTQRVYTTDTAV